jgi:hypothetical protein
LARPLSKDPGQIAVLVDATFVLVALVVAIATIVAVDVRGRALGAAKQIRARGHRRVDGHHGPGGEFIA